MEILRVIGILLFFTGIYTNTYAQHNPLKGWSEAEINRANTAKNASYMKEEEKKVVLYCNLARMNGRKFIKTFVLPHVGRQRNTYINSLIRDLNRTKNKKMYLPNQKLYQAAQYHANDMGKTGKMAHSSSNGTSFSKRIYKFYSRAGAIAENCGYGNKNALGFVMQLLIDEGVPSLGHRKNILADNYKSIGVSIRPHKKWGANCVQDFSSTLPEKK